MKLRFWGLAFLPDGSVLISSRTTAQIHRVSSIGETPQLVGTVPDISVSSEGGLLGLVASPTFETDRSIYAYMSASPTNKVVRLKINENFNDISIEEVVLDGITTANRHHGGRLAIGPDGNLWITTGDAFEPTLAQDTQSLNGKILRIRLDGTIPDGNLGNTPIYSYGHRNVQGIAFASDDTVYASELGHRTWDELNNIKPGLNYGWANSEGIQGDFGERPIAVFHPDDCSPAGLAYTKGYLWMGGIGRPAVVSNPSARWKRCRRTCSTLSWSIWPYTYYRSCFRWIFMDTDI